MTLSEFKTILRTLSERKSGHTNWIQFSKDTCLEVAAFMAIQGNVRAYDHSLYPSDRIWETDDTVGNIMVWIDSQPALHAQNVQMWAAGQGIGYD